MQLKPKQQVQLQNLLFHFMVYGILYVISKQKDYSQYPDPH